MHSTHKQQRSRARINRKAKAARLIAFINEPPRYEDDTPGVCVGLYKAADCPRCVINFRDIEAAEAARAYWEAKAGAACVS